MTIRGPTRAHCRLMSRMLKMSNKPIRQELIASSSKVFYDCNAENVICRQLVAFHLNYFLYGQSYQKRLKRNLTSPIITVKTNYTISDYGLRSSQID